MDTTFVVIIAVLALLVGLAVGYYISRTQYEGFQRRNREKADKIVSEANERARAIELQARDDALKVSQAAETEINRLRSELNKEDERLQHRRTELDARVERLEQREQAVNKRQSSVDKRANEIEKLHEQQIEELQRVAQLSLDEARTLLLDEVEKDARNDMARIIRQIETEAREEGEKRARNLIADSIQRVATDNVAEFTTSLVPLPNEEMKGRIVGRNGRNIRAFEQAAGVDVIVDDTPEAVTISCFEPVRREVARRALSKLILDGRIHPAHI
jgi:ribonuclease Y